MTQFKLNVNVDSSSPFHDLDAFTQGYIEAMFFTNGDTGDENEDLLNELGVAAITPESMKSIVRDCERFKKEAAALLEEATGRGYSARFLGIDFWQTRQGYIVELWFEEVLYEDGLSEKLTDIARKFGAATVCVCGDEIIY